MRLRPENRKRRGTSLVETALVMVVFLTLILGTLDLGLGVFRNNTLSQAARQLARQAVVHGSLSQEVTTPWGPSTYGPVAANDTGAIATALQPYLVGMDPANVTVTVTWLDGGNAPDQDQRVRVTLSVPYQPMMTFIFGNPTYTLTATSTMYIAH
jgi:Flp pilus assembly protein TadG